MPVVARSAPPSRRVVPSAHPAPRDVLEWVRDLLAVALATVGLTSIVYRVWQGPWRVPLDVRVDGLAQLADVKMVAQTGWYTGTSRLGAPFGLQTYDFPRGGENLHWVGIKAITLVVHDPVLAQNLYFLGGFTLSALAAFTVLRLLGARRVVAAVLAEAFAFAPYHLARGTGHLFLGIALSVPFACYVLIRLASPNPPLLDGGRFVLRRRATLGWVLIAVLVGSSSSYYALMTAILVVVVGAVVAAVDRSWRLAACAVAIAAAIAVVLAVNTAPTILYQASHGSNPVVAQRSLGELDAFPLRVTQLLTPVTNHRFAPLATLTDDVEIATGTTETQQHLGTLATIGFVVALAALARRALGKEAQRQQAFLGLVIVLLVAIGSAGGLSWFAYLLGATELRSWARLAIFVMFLALVALIPLAERMAARVERLRWHPRVASWAVATAVVALCLLDQVGNGAARTPAANAPLWESQRQFVAAIERQLPAHAMVFQLPYRQYPEGGSLGGIGDYDLMVGFLHSTALRWSYGAMKGRPADWSEPVTRLEPQALLDTVSSAGFDGLTIDRRGVAADQEAAMKAVLAQLPLEGVGGQLAFYDLRAYRDRRSAELGTASFEALGRHALDRPTFRFLAGFDGRQLDGDAVLHASHSHATLVVDNTSGKPYDGQLSFDANSVALGAHRLTVSFAGRRVAQTIDPAYRHVTIALTLPPGSSTLTFSADAPDVLQGGRRVSFFVKDMALS